MRAKKTNSAFIGIWYIRRGFPQRILLRLPRLISATAARLEWAAESFLQILAPELTDRMLADFLDLDMGIGVNIHIKSIDQSEAIKTVKRKITDLDKMKIEEQKKAVRSGYDMDIIPSDLATFGGEAKNLLEQLQSRNERMFLVTVLVMNTADNKQKLDNMFFAAQGIAQK